MLLFVSMVIATSMKLRLTPLTSEELEQQRKEAKFISVSVLVLLFLSVVIILGNWVYHIKEKKSFRYLIHGVLGFLIGIMYSLLFFFILFPVLMHILFLFIVSFNLFNLGALAEILFYGLPILLFLGGCFFEFISYKKTKKLFWVYALIFSIVMIIYILILVFYTRFLTIF